MILTLMEAREKEYTICLSRDQVCAPYFPSLAEYPSPNRAKMAMSPKTPIINEVQRKHTTMTL